MLKYAFYMNHTDQIDDILEDGKLRAGWEARANMLKIQERI